MQQKVIRTGRNSLAVIIPAKFVHSLGVKAGDMVRVQTNIGKGVLRIRFSGAIQLPLPTPKKEIKE
ncbi:AbrB/MazE/SpoVT family DNA-binding domain-containing protein [Candidatus Gottesmanbacteria bacterium]|nr:AbrB/MazE/SpoVT family DNA-binding domain-containing protein [Candidatus Gottesmanbacteria bacterium]